MVLPLPSVIPVALFHEGPFRWRSGTRLIGPDEWLQFDPAELDANRAEKAAILRDAGSSAFVAEPGSESAGLEVEALVLAALVTAGLTPLELADSLHPLDRAARHVHEDLIVLRQQPGGWVMTAGSVCFPTRWDPADKIGQTMAAIHAPVPQYDTIAPAVDRLFDRLRPGSIVWRPNWSVVGEPDLRLPVDDRQAPRALPDDPDSSLWLRVERQTLRRLVAHPDHAVFGVRIHRWPLGEVLDAVDHTLAGALRTMPDDIAVYKNLDAWRHELADHLEGSRPG